MEIVNLASVMKIVDMIDLVICWTWTWILDREGFQKKVVLLNFVQMRGVGRALSNFFVTFS